MAEMRYLLAVLALSQSILIRVEAQTIRVEPHEALVDQPIRVGAVGLTSGSVATFRARRTDGSGQLWESSVDVRASERRSIDLTRQSPTAGSYSGVVPMGLLTSMNVAGENRGRLRYPFKWSDTLRTEISLEVAGRIVSVDTLVQSFAARDVITRPFRDSGLVGTLFRPGGAKRSPGVLVLGGSEGGLSSEDVAATLASRGYVAVALAYFGVAPLPAALDEIPVEYFGRAIRLLMRDSSVAPGGIGLVATSKGAEVALLVATKEPAVRAVVAYEPSSVIWSCICGAAAHSSWSFGGVGVPFVPAGTNPDYRPAPGTPIRPTENYTYRMRDSSVAAGAAIAVERIRGPILMIAGGDDGLWPSLGMGRAVLSRRRRLGGSSADALLEYPGAGHLIGKAYLPVGSTLVGGGRLETGGTIDANAAAQADAWPKVLAFLRAALGEKR